MSDDITFSQRGKCGLITLDRPPYLNALTPYMITVMSDQLCEWGDDTSIKYVLVKSSSEKAFCAGGDIKHIYESGIDDPQTDFFRQEYLLNGLIHNYSKPYISLIDGLVMGGGVGISYHGSHCIAGDNLVFAMPETGIGFFPDIGSSYFLSRLPGYFGVYLGLTGTRLSAKESVDIGLSTHYCPSSRLSSLEELLCSDDVPDDPSSIISEFCEYTGSSTDSLHIDQVRVERVFSQKSIDAIYESLTSIVSSNDSDSDWAREILGTLRSKSPVSLHLAHRLLSQASYLSIEDCLQLEYRLAYHLLRQQNFYEGIRAAVIDKDRNPNWQESSIPLPDYFAPLPDNEDLVI